MSLPICSSILQYTNLNILKYFSTWLGMITSAAVITQMLKDYPLIKVLRNHYDILNLPRTCTAKEIKDSFIKLSKEHHPDVNKNKNAHKRFLEINEAYKILSNRESRQLYDLSLVPEGISYRNEIRVPYREQFGSDPWKDPSFYMNRNKADDKKYEDQPYYGIKGLKRVSNLTVVAVCLTIATIVLGLQVLAVKYSFTFKRDELIRRSNAAQESLRQVRETAAVNGNDLQLELLKQKMADNAKYKART